MQSSRWSHTGEVIHKEHTLEAYSKRKMNFILRKNDNYILSLFYLLKIIVHLCPFEFINIFIFG